MSTSLGAFVESYAAELLARAAEYERDGVTVPATIHRRVASELVERHRTFENEAVSVREAAAITGYDESAIRKMRNDGRLPETIRRGDLPRKPGYELEASPRAGRASLGHSIADRILASKRRHSAE